MAVPDQQIVTKVIFPVADMDEAVAFYERLGFEIESYDGGYAWVRHRGGEVLHLRRVEGLDREANQASGYFHVRDADAWYTAWAGEAASLGPIEDLPWGMREFRIIDPSGNLLRVGANLPA